MTKPVAVSPYNMCFKTKGSKGFKRDITIYDTTLRDGEQMPGVAFKPAQKRNIAFYMDSIGVPQIELGFPAVSKTEPRTIRSITREGLNAKTLALSRLTRSDVDLCIDCGVDTILLFIATSELHLKYKLNKSRSQVLSSVTDTVEYAKDRGALVSFSSEDTTRSDLTFVHRCNKAAVDCGARRIGITDTVGCANPEAIGHIVGQVRKRLPSNVSLGLHLHNDYGLAVANAFSGLNAGANAVATTVLGIGERAGNVPLEEFLVGLRYLYGRDLGVDLRGLTPLAKMVAGYAGLEIPLKNPLVGRNAFSHESGLHVAAVLKDPRTYESLDPGLVGNQRHFMIGKHSGHAHIRVKLSDRNVQLDDKAIDRVLILIKDLGERKGEVSEKEFWSIVKRVQR